MENNENQLEGRNAVLMAINHDKPIDKIFIKKGEIEGTLKVIVAKAKEKGLVTSFVTKQKLDEMSHSHNHQGVIAICPAKEYVDVSDILEYAREKGEHPFIIILDSITDTYNLGGIIRSADACGAHGVIIPKRRAATLTGTVSKASAGALSFVKVARVSNIADTITKLQKEGVWVCCGDMEAEPMYKQDLTGPICLVVGGEDAGVSRIIKEKCDYRVSIPMFGEVSSLNASVAAGILMYEIIRQRINNGLPVN